MLFALFIVGIASGDVTFFDVWGLIWLYPILNMEVYHYTLPQVVSIIHVRKFDFSVRLTWIYILI